MIEHLFICGGQTVLRDKALIKVLIDAGGRGMCTRACQRCVAQPKGMLMLVSQARKRARRMRIGGLTGKPNLIGMVTHGRVDHLWNRDKVLIICGTVRMNRLSLK